MDGVVVGAVRDNAGWCDMVCRTHGLTGVTDDDAWSVPHRSPTWYPDAVTMRPGVPPAALLDRIEVGPGASVKDSFADLDLTRYGFRVLFTARWIHRAVTTATTGPALTPVRTPEALAVWAGAHGGGPLFRPALLDDSRVTILARHDVDGVTGGAVLHRGSRMVGVSNVFARVGSPDEVFAALPGVDPLVGYESGDDLAAARRAGFRPIGPLRVWLRD